MGTNFILTNLSIDFADDISATELEASITKLDEAIRRTHLDIKWVFIESEARQRFA